VVSDILNQGFRDDVSKVFSPGSQQYLRNFCRSQSDFSLSNLALEFREGFCGKDSAFSERFQEHIDRLITTHVTDAFVRESQRDANAKKYQPLIKEIRKRLWAVQLSVLLSESN
jgi:hypothetical protein